MCASDSRRMVIASASNRAQTGIWTSKIETWVLTWFRDVKIADGLHRISSVAARETATQQTGAEAGAGEDAFVIWGPTDPASYCHAPKSRAPLSPGGCIDRGHR